MPDDTFLATCKGLGLFRFDPKQEQQRNYQIFSTAQKEQVKRELLESYPQALDLEALKDERFLNEVSQMLCGTIIEIAEQRDNTPQPQQPRPQPVLQAVPAISILRQVAQNQKKDTPSEKVTAVIAILGHPQWAEIQAGIRAKGGLHAYACLDISEQDSIVRSLKKAVAALEKMERPQEIKSKGILKGTLRLGGSVVSSIIGKTSSEEEAQMLIKNVAQYQRPTVYTSEMKELIVDPLEAVLSELKGKAPSGRFR